MKKVKTFLLNGLLLTATSIFISTIAVSFNVYITNKIGTEAIGIYQLIMSIYMFATTIALSGIGLASTRVVAEELALNKELGAKKAIRKCILFSILFGVISATILFVSSDFIAQNWLHGKISTKPLHIIAISLPFLAISASLNGYFNAVRRVAKSASAQVLDQFIRIGITVYILNLLLPNGLENACLALVIGACLSQIFSCIYLFILYLFDKRRYSNYEKEKSRHTKKILGIAMPVAMTSYIRSGLATFKQIITPMQLEKSGMNCDIALSKYGMISGMVMPILLFPSAIISSFSSLLTPEISRYYATNNNQKIKEVIIKIFKPTFIFSICIIGIFFTFAKPLSIALYNNTEIITYIKILSPLIPIMYIDTVVDSILKGLNEQVSVMKYNIIDLVVSTCCIYFLLPIMGINGYIIAIVASECVNTFLSALKLIRVTQFKINYKDWVIKPLFCTLLAFSASRLFALHFSTSVSMLVVQIILHILLYLVFLYLVSCISKKDLTF